MALKRRLIFGAIAAVSVLVLTFTSLMMMLLLTDLGRRVPGAQGVSSYLQVMTIGFATGFLLAPLWYRGTFFRLLALWIAPGIIFGLICALPAIASVGRADRILPFMVLAIMVAPIWLVLLAPLDPGLFLVWLVASSACWELGRNLQREALRAVPPGPGRKAGGAASRS